jgi:hypothetical protein
MGKEMFIIRRIGRREIAPIAYMDITHAYNKMHVGYPRVHVEWGIGRLKRKWRRLMKSFDSTKPRYSHLFKSRALLTNFLHRRKMELTYGLLVTIFIILKTTDGLGTSNYMCRQALTCALNSSSKIILNSLVAFKFEIFTLFLRSWLMSIFVANNASRISELT